MSRPKDPVIAVLKYFQTADLALAQQALALAQQTVRARQPSARPRPVTRKTPPATQVASGE